MTSPVIFQYRHNLGSWMMTSPIIFQYRHNLGSWMMTSPVICQYRHVLGNWMMTYITRDSILNPSIHYNANGDWVTDVQWATFHLYISKNKFFYFDGINNDAHFVLNWHSCRHVATIRHIILTLLPTNFVFTPSYHMLSRETSNACFINCEAKPMIY